LGDDFEKWTKINVHFSKYENKIFKDPIKKPILQHSAVNSIKTQKMCAA
jgi:hypothetical protein